MVKHYRVGLDEKYEVTKRWSLNDLRMIDGKEADTVSVSILERQGRIDTLEIITFDVLLYRSLACTKCEDDILLFLSGMD